MKRTGIIASAIVLAVFSAAISIYGAVSEQPAKQAENPVISAPVTADTLTSAESQITVEKAIEIAQADVKTFTESEQNVIKSKLDYDDGITEYDIKIVAGDTEYEYEINAATGNITKRDIEKVRSEKSEKSEKSQKSEKKASDSKNVAFDESLYITEEEAKTIALEYAKIDSASAVFTECKLDREDGIVVYEIELYANQTEYEFEIDAASGAVIEFEIDD